MKITKVETIVVQMPMLIEGSVLPKQGGKPRTSMDTLLVRVDTDEGVSGWGEGFGHRIFTATKAALDSFIGPMCIGRDPTASIHCIAAMSGDVLVERYDADFAVNPLQEAIMPDKNGHIAVPQGPGLGAEVDLAVVEKLRVR